MSTKFNIITKTTYKMFCDKTRDIQVIENDLEMRRVTLMDKSGNKCRIHYDENDIIIALTRVEANDPVYMLYLLVTLTDAIFLSEDNFKNCIQIPLRNKLNTKIAEITKGTYEEFTNYFKDIIKYVRDFDKESQLLNPNGQIDSNKTSIESHFLDVQNSSNVITKSMLVELRRIDDYFELDEDFKIEKIGNENQGIVAKNNII